MTFHFDGLQLRFCGNTYDPRKPDSERHIRYDWNEHPDVSLERHRLHIRSKLIGKPQGSDVYTVEELEQQSYVGLYRFITDKEELIREAQYMVEYNGPLYEWVSRTGWIKLNLLTDNIFAEKCPSCKGTGFINLGDCNTCKGLGTV